MLEVGGADEGARGARAAAGPTRCVQRMTKIYIFKYFYVYEYMPNQSKMMRFLQNK